jgi:four helix bundle protein
MKITRKEAKETTYWLELILETNPFLEIAIKLIIQESKELRNIFTSIINKSK